MASESPWIHEARTVLAHSTDNYFQVKPWRYWVDFISSVVPAYIAATIFLQASLFSWQQAIAFPLAVFWLYRSGSLVHEVAHLGQSEMRLFKVVWNLVVGVITLSPSPFFTRHHRDHHSVRLYGTRQDPEYVRNFCPWQGSRGIVCFVAEILLMPLVVLLRFLLVPFTYIHPRARDFILRRGSSLTWNWRYERRLTRQDRLAIGIIELLCWIRALMIPLAVLLGWTNWTRLPLLYVLAVSVVGLNQLRLLADHHLSSDGNALDMESHILDSCNYTRPDWLTRLFFPFSIRYHALHHLFPSLPYHNLQAAHEHLLKGISPTSPYRTLDRPSWWSVARVAFQERTSLESSAELREPQPQPSMP